LVVNFLVEIVMSKKQELVYQLQQILPDILCETPVMLAYLYGSIAADQALPGSDVDIALVVCSDSSELSPQQRMALEFAIEGALEQHGIVRPDVRVINDLPLTFRGEVAISGVRLYARDEVARVEFETRTWKEYLDFEPVTRMMRQAFFDHVRQHGLLSKRKA
jgi:predicted nucleotidyltransferase